MRIKFNYNVIRLFNIYQQKVELNTSINPNYEKINSNNQIFTKNKKLNKY